MDWKDELKKKWYLHTRKEGQQPYKAELSFTTCEEEVIEFIESLLKKQRKEIFETIQIGYYQCVVDTQRNADILKAELQDLVNEYKKIEPGDSDGLER